MSKGRLDLPPFQKLIFICAYICKHFVAFNINTLNPVFSGLQYMKIDKKENETRPAKEKLIIEKGWFVPSIHEKYLRN